MELKQGDKVRFLNEKGGGIVTGIISNTLVNVAIEEGFIVPVQVKDLILIEPKGAADRFFDRQVKVNLPEKEAAVPGKTPAVPGKASETAPPANNQGDERISYLFRQSGIRATEGIYMAFAPHDQQWLISGSLDIFLVNNTGYDAIFSFSLMEDEKGYAGVDYDVIPPYSKLLLETINREDLEGWTDGVVQVIFHRSEISQVLSPLHAAFKIKPVRFYKETSYQDFPLIGQKAVLVNLGDLAGQVIISSSETFAISGIDPAAKQKLSSLTPAAVIDIHKTAPFEAEVDLHISALRQDYAKMPQNEILNYQVEYFGRMLESAIAHSYKKVIFIHGIGNGTLKTAIKARLAGYENIEVHNAPFAKYGYGAIEVKVNDR